MTRRKKSPKLYGLLSDPPPMSRAHSECDTCRPLQRYMVVQLRLDRGEFDALKELLRETSTCTKTRSSDPPQNPSEYITQERLKRVFDQIRDMEYNDK